MNKEDKIVKSVIDSYKERADFGFAKYGTTLERNDLTLMQWLQHLQEELMDATLYIEKLKSELTQNDVIFKEGWDNADKIIHDGFVYIKYADLK